MPAAPRPAPRPASPPARTHPAPLPAPPRPLRALTPPCPWLALTPSRPRLALAPPRPAPPRAPGWRSPRPQSHGGRPPVQPRHPLCPQHRGHRSAQGRVRLRAAGGGAAGGRERLLRGGRGGGQGRRQPRRQRPAAAGARCPRLAPRATQGGAFPFFFVFCTPSHRDNWGAMWVGRREPARGAAASQAAAGRPSRIKLPGGEPPSQRPHSARDAPPGVYYSRRCVEGARV